LLIEIKVFLLLFFQKKKFFFLEPLLWRAPPTSPRAEKQKTFNNLLPGA